MPLLEFRCTRWAAWLSCLCVAFFSVGCSAGAAPQAAKVISTAGVKASDALAQFYDKLADDCNDVAELDATVMTMNLGTSSEVEKEIAATSNAYVRYAAAFRLRAAAARKLGGLYTALGGLAGSDVVSGTSTAAENLSKAVTALPGFQGELKFDPSTLTGMIAGDLTTVQQAHDIQTANAKIGQVLAGFRQLFDAERGIAVYFAAQPTTQPANQPLTQPVERPLPNNGGTGNNLYRVIVTRRSHLAGTLAVILIKRGYIDPSAVMKQLADAYGIPWNGEMKSDDANAHAAAATVQAFELARQGELAMAAADDISTALRSLAAQQASFANKGAFDVSQVAASINRAQAYIDEIEDIRKQIKAANDERQKQKEKDTSATQPVPTSH